MSQYRWAVNHQHQYLKNNNKNQIKMWNGDRSAITNCITQNAMLCFNTFLVSPPYLVVFPHFQRVKLERLGHLEENRLFITTIFDVLREPLEKFGIFSLVDGTQGRSGYPTTRIDYRTIGDLASQVITRDRSAVGWWLDRRLTNQTHRQGNPHHFPLVGLKRRKKNLIKTSEL